MKLLLPHRLLLILIALNLAIETDALRAAELPAAPLILHYARPEVRNDHRSDYPLQVLQLALSKTSENVVFMASDSIMDQERALWQMDVPNGGIDVVWTMTSTERERQYIPIRIPVDKGLLGWRLALIPAGKPRQFRNTAHIADLQKLTACQGHDWPDTGILRANGLPVIVDASYDNLFSLVSKGSADYFPRSVNEIWDELATRQGQGIGLDPYIALHYQAAMYFFVAKSNRKLADAILAGLEKAIADGSFDRLFNSVHRDILRKANLSARRVIQLDNPLLSPLTPFNRKELWYTP